MHSPVPNFVSEYEKDAAILLKNQFVHEPDFSRGTYQVEVFDGKVSFFPFLQITDEGALADVFCTCGISEEKKGCPHLAAAWLRIFNGTTEPLHVRFWKSLWNRLFQMASKRHGYDTNCLHKNEKKYCCVSSTKKLLFSIEPLNAAASQRLQYIISERVIETEETSIKFFNLTSEQIIQWREGKASHILRYELSFWSDLAKWLMHLCDEGEKYDISFEQEPHRVAHAIHIRFPDLAVRFYIADANWPWLIPSLSSVHSPLKVFDEVDRQKPEIFYDPDRRMLTVASTTRISDETSLKGIIIGDWVFVEGKGFYRKYTDPFMGKSEVKALDIGSLLTRSAAILQPRLNVLLHLDSVPARYWLYFDENASLHVQLFIFEPGDLSQPQAACFFPWVFLPSPENTKGFWKLEELMFDSVERIVLRGRVADFIDRHRHWLHQFTGFQVHLGSLEAHMIYSFNDQGSLLFTAKLEFPEHTEEAIDFGEWVYVKGQGFYMKKQNRGRMPLHPGMSVPESEIPAFLTAHREDLEHVDGFFVEPSPVIRGGLAIHVTSEGRIALHPIYEYTPDVNPADVRFYGDFAYLKNHGFTELPTAARLPERFRHVTKIPEHQEAAFLVYDLDPLRPYILEMDPRLKKPEHLHLQIRNIIRNRKKRATQWLVDAAYVSDMGCVDLLSVWDALQSGKNYLFSPAGILSLKDVRFNWVRQLPGRRLDRKRKLIRMSVLEWIRLTIFEEMQPPLGDKPGTQQAQAILSELNQLGSNRLLDVSHLKSTLRPYQELGVQWLWFLYCHGLSGLLCDDMGLGKTHQAMALLAAATAGSPNDKLKYLIVCPTSVIYHWRELLQRFLPNLRVLVFYGLSRTLENFESNYDVLLTSYGILRSGTKDIGSLFFEIAIFDEIQIAKNHRSQTHLALRRITTQMRLGLTGTPIENRLRELKSIFDVVLPGYMPSEAVFREQFIRPIEKNQDPEKKALLIRLIRPFILRRKKNEVLTDLPEKIEEISYCDLSEEQRSLYQSVALQMCDTACRELRDKSKPVSYVHIFSILSTLKQICDHPALYLNDVKRYASHSSNKWDLFLELIDEARESGQKVVVFSQYLGMLAMIEMELKKRGIGYATIKGATRDRPEQLHRFRENPDCLVFVASLLAAGVGIDLTVASIVIHYDRWWNPAKENQATDRVHRIGQSRGVQVFKLVTKNSIEEHIHTLIEKKRNLLEGVVGHSDLDQITYLSRDELLAVFELTLTRVRQM
jgi:superfamily II DNA or RNA helicase